MLNNGEYPTFKTFSRQMSNYLCYFFPTDLTKIPFLKSLISISRLIVPNDENLFTESNLANWFSSSVQFFCQVIISQNEMKLLGSVKKMNHFDTYSITACPITFEHKNDVTIILLLKYKPQASSSVKFDNDCDVIFILKM